MRLWILSVMLLILLPTVRSSAQTDSQLPAPGLKKESRDSSIPLTRNVQLRENQPTFLPVGNDPENRIVTPFMKHLALDQKQFWTAPLHLDRQDSKTLFPFAAFTGALMAGDDWISRQVPGKASQINRSKSISDYATYSLIGAAGGSYIWGHLTHNDHLRETGFLAGEAALNSTAVTYLFKTMTQRPRPLERNGSGTFFQGGLSFPSEHSAIAWSVASVVAHEYPGTLTKIAAYGLASTVTLTRVAGKQHFPSDVVVGSALGWYFARQIYRAHHDPELGGAGWGELIESKPEGSRNPENMGSPYVALDSWVYPAFEKLIALGYVQSAHLGIRPWTRMECARLLEEADENMRDDGVDERGLAQSIDIALSEEFIDETARLSGAAANLGVSLDSVYTRVTGISGPPLRDGYHFGQTIVNDYGRPYGEGFNNITGFSTHAVAGPFSFDVRGEYQHAPASPAYPLAVQQAIANADLTTPVPNAIAQLDRFRLLEGQIGLQFHNVAFSFGKQNVWLGAGESGSLLLSNNADSILMLKIDSVTPYRVPLLSSLLGPLRSEYFLGQLSGHLFEFNGATNTLLGPGNITPQPFLQGMKVSFKPTPNFEFGMGFSAQFVGPGLPFTFKNFLRALYSHTSGANNPGKRISELDLSYRVPGLRKWLTVYGDSLVVDEFSPIGSTRPTLNPGIYMPQIPKLPKLELRAEGLKEPLTTEFAPGYVYYGVRRYRSGYTNDGNLMGAWIGRAGRGGQGWLTYSFSPRSKIQLGYRHQEVSKDFIGGGRLVDYSARGDLMLAPGIGLSSFLQYEQWRFPVLAPDRHSNVTATFQFTFYPHWRIRK
jgi:hypothetical protein